MKRTLLHTMTAAVVVLAGTTVAAAPAIASDAPGFVCNLNQNTWLRTDPHGFVLRTLTAGRGFRWHGQAIDDGSSVWIYGHGAEAPGQDGWIPAANANC
ncbi:hypothetical protein Cme02nite_31020 [Catellatospora methionotrophica]|uniref:SH3 domain-containing protein n=1 Tax=Catellatospora methionotrophica TaxID=121620 RepID=A0A8J3LHV1_9ACTN|nr:hypothetical protein [Catellatospora methionotrophica]GIG14770.1 hypothetical protein Cme02nite_31020 [Catellatospora methionotrophica]